MGIKHGGLLGYMNEDRWYPAGGIPNHMLPRSLCGVGVHRNALRNSLLEGACRQTDDQGQHDNANEHPAPRKRRATHDVRVFRFLHCPKTVDYAIIPLSESSTRLQKPFSPYVGGCKVLIKGCF